jgi:two-component system NarL family sensor kinase
MTSRDVVMSPPARPATGCAAGRVARRRSLWWGVVAAAGLALSVNLGLEARHFPSQVVDDTVWFGAWLSYVAVGALVLHRRPGPPIGRVLVAAGASIQLAGVVDTLSLLASQSIHVRGWAPWLAWVAELAFLPAVFLVAVALPLLLPSGWLSGPGARRLLEAGVVAWGIWFVAYAVRPGQLDTSDLTNPVGLAAVPWLAPALVLVGGIALATIAVLCVGSLGLQWRRSVDEERRGLAYLAVAAVAQIVLFLVVEIMGQIGWDAPAWVEHIGAFAVIATLPVAVGLAILRTGLLDIELVLRRTLTYLAMTLAVLAVYAVTVLAVGGVTSHTDRLSTSLLVTGLAAVGLSPLRERAQRQVDRLLYGRRADPYGVLRELDSAMAANRTAADVLPSLTEVIARSLRIPYVAIDLGDSTQGGPVARIGYGAPCPIVRELGMEHHGRRVGTLLLAARSRGERLTSLDDKLLREVADHASSAVAAVALAEDAQHSRERLVRALEEDRRRIRRDLHDHLGPVLSGITLQLDALRRMRAGDEESTSLTDTIRGEVAAAVVDVRRLVHGLRPPILDELGLADAVRHHADLVASEIEVTVIADQLPPLPAAVDLAAYRIVTEALTNTLRHAGASSVGVRLFFVDERLEVEVHDNGSGIAEDAARGVGLESMRERVADLGGLLTIASSRSGTTVRVELPA